MKKILLFILSGSQVLISYTQIKIDSDKLQKQIQSAIAAVEKSSSAKRSFTLEEIWKENKFKPDLVYGLNSMKDGIHYTSLETDTTGNSYIIKFSYKTGEAIDTLLRSSSLIPEGKDSAIAIESYSLSDDESRVLISTESEPIYRHSSKEIYYIYELKSGKLSKVTDEKVRLAEFSPDGKYVAYVKLNNLFIKNISENQARSGAELQITSDGKWNEIINGSTDWVYEEEFSFDKAFFWSPDGKRIAYYRFDESMVKEFSIDMFGALYPSQYRYKYPKAGEENAKVSIHVYDLETKKTTAIKPQNSYEYIPRIKWTKDPKVLSLQAMNRHQSQLDLMLADSEKGLVTTILTEKSESYIEITDDLTFLDDRKHFIRTSEKSGYNHLYLYDISGKPVRQLTNGNWDVTEFKGVDEKNQTVFYLSSEESPVVRKLYSIKTDGTAKKNLTGKNGNNTAEFSRQYKYYLNYFSDAYSPYRITLNDASGKEIRVLKDNQKLKDTLGLYAMSLQEFFKFKTSDNILLNGWMIRPQNFDSTRKYPVLMFVYGGPGSQTVENKWAGNSMLWYQYLAQKGYIVVSVDNRGTGARGADFKKCTYKELGKLETADQIEAAKFLGTLGYVDKNRIGIQGWSYGGYMSSLCITKGADYFKMAIAVAPVTNWRFYDSIYTERYMQTPQENPLGYDENSPINHVDKLRGKYLLVHGTADDNVHFQNSVEMVDALVKAGKQFDLFFYPNKNHGIYGGNTRLHLYTLLSDYILENL